jgi:Asp-tRNA(Asn)/Glu-tRNA(Gln) amidotransferase A subunit family amidase
MTYDDYIAHDALGLAALVRDKEVSAAELLEIAIARTEDVNPQLNAVVLKHYDLARAQVAAGLPDGPFTGVPFLVKDLFVDVAGTTTTSGSCFLKDSVAKVDSTVAARYKRAGLVIYGKTHSPELGGGPTTESSLFGVTRNPWDLSVTPGGSSGGSAAAVAAGMTPIANGSDAGGSIRMPAALCGLFGMKPTRGRVPLGPARFDGGGGVATVHALTRSVRDSAALLDVSSGPEPGAIYASAAQRRPFQHAVDEAPPKLRIALNMAGISHGGTDSVCIDAARDAARKCEALGHIVTEASPDLDVELFMRARDKLWAATICSAVLGLQRAYGRAAKPEDFEPWTWKQYEAGLQVRGDEVLMAREAMFTLHKQFASFMQNYDVVLSPALQTLGPTPGTISTRQTSDEAIRQVSRYVAFSFIFNFTGQPSMAVPLYWSPDTGMPVGVQFSGRFGDEDLLFRLAGQLERAYPWFDKLPPQPFRQLQADSASSPF